MLNKHFIFHLTLFYDLVLLHNIVFIST